MIRLRFLSALILLVVSLVLTSGASATATALLQEGAATDCCDAAADKPAAPFDVPCSEPDCQCITCLAFVVTLHSRLPVYNGYHATSSFNRLFSVLPHEYVKTIDYPPEFS